MATCSIVCVRDFETWANSRLARDVLGYFRGGADDEQTANDNFEAFQRWRILPRVLRDVSQRDLSTTILGLPISFPVCVAPTALLGLVHSQGEIGTAMAAQNVKTVVTLSTVSNRSIEEVTQAAPDVVKFFQVYIFKDREITKRLVLRAKKNGFKALVLTVDAPFAGKRIADIRNDFKASPHVKLGNFGEEIGGNPSEKHLHSFVSSILNSALTWSDVKWLKSISGLPVIVKGILSGADAKLAVEAGAAAILVSNHGGRQLDTVPATLDVLPEVVAAVEGRCEVYLDGGVRLGTDVFKALALGARAVFVGRPAVFSLAYNGAEGVTQMLQILKDELSTAMALSGCSRIGDISQDLLRHKSSFISKI